MSVFHFLGCDTGFGHMLAQRLDMLGVNVLAACLTDSAQTRLKSVTSSRLRTLKLDVTNSDEINKAVDFVTAQLPENQGKAELYHIFPITILLFFLTIRVCVIVIFSVMSLCLGLYVCTCSGCRSRLSTRSLGQG